MNLKPSRKFSTENSMRKVKGTYCEYISGRAVTGAGVAGAGVAGAPTSGVARLEEGLRALGIVEEALANWSPNGFCTGDYKY